MRAEETQEKTGRSNGISEMKLALQDAEEEYTEVEF